MQDVAGHTPYWAKENVQPSSASPVDTEAQRATAVRLEPVIRCAACGHRITHEQERISVGDSHDHRFFNPHGFLFHIGCFRTAAGCAARGEPTTEFSWFPGFAWRHAVCLGCGNHLGWRFENDSGYCFFGLVLNRLIADDVASSQ